jgi:YfbU domain
MLSASIDRLSADDRAALGDDNEDRLRFGGFDLNDFREGGLLGYVRHLVDTDRWTEIKPRLADIGDNGNSHSRRLPAYERMLAVYMPILEDGAKGKRGHSIGAWLLTVDELKQIAEAWAWPAGFQNSATGLDLGSYAARSYSLMRPPRTGRRVNHSIEYPGGTGSARSRRSPVTSPASPVTTAPSSTVMVISGNCLHSRPRGGQ